MATAYLFNLPYHGHINPCVPIIRALTRRGERVICYAPDGFRRMIEGAGGLFRSFGHQEEAKGRGLVALAEWQVRVSEACLEQLAAQAAADRPEYLLVDYSCFWGRSLAACLGVPVIYIHSTIPTQYSLRLAFRITLLELRKSPELRLSFIRFLRADHRLARKWRIPRLGLPINLLCPRNGTLHLVLTTRELCGGLGQVDERYAFVGPCVRQPGCPDAEALPPMDERPLIYISLGTFWNNRPDFFRTCIQAFSSTRYQVLIAHGSGISEHDIGPLPAHIHLRSYVDQIAVLARAAVFVTHGGMNSICESALAGVPMLVFPQAADQFKQARFVRDHGAGMILAPSEITPEHISRTVARVLDDPRIRACSQAIGDKLRAAGGADLATDLILNLASHFRSNPCSSAIPGTPLP